jgi:hypothetical protein
VQHALGKYVELFAEVDVGLDILSDLNDQRLEQLGVSLGDRVRKTARDLLDELH